MRITENFKMAFRSITSHKLRSILTMIGIIIGVASVISIVAIGQGGEATLKTQFTGMNNSLDIFFEQDEDTLDIFDETETTFTDEQVHKLASIPEIKHVIQSNSEIDHASFLDQTVMTGIIGIDGGYFSIYPISLVDGRTFSTSELKDFSKVTLINDKLSDSLFKKENPIGKVIELNSIPLRVIGVYEDESMFTLEAPQLIIPLSLWPMVYQTSEIQSVTIQVNHADDIEVASNKALHHLNSNQDELNGEYIVYNLEEIERNLSSISKVMTYTIGGIASISLLVSGVGVMNIMLVSVSERTREIGIRKAIGASNRSIMTQFLIEAVTLSVIGGILGIGLGLGIAIVFLNMIGWPVVISYQTVLIGIVFSMSIGIIFGTFPAQKAASLHPIDALQRR